MQPNEELIPLSKNVTWRCFHCDFVTSDPAEAAAHFGDIEDAEEFKPLCKWWSNMDDQERKEQFQAVIRELNGEHERIARLEAENAALALKNAALEAQLLEPAEQCENCDDYYATSVMQMTEDDVRLCPSCWEACCWEACCEETAEKGEADATT